MWALYLTAGPFSSLNKCNPLGSPLESSDPMTEKGDAQRGWRSWPRTHSLEMKLVLGSGFTRACVLSSTHHTRTPRGPGDAKFSEFTSTLDTRFYETIYLPMC